MTASRHELCCACGELTDRAGKADDSLYLLNEGPFCEGCYEVRTSYAGIVDAQLRQHITELEAEVERLKGELQQERADRERAWIANWRFTISVESSEPQRPGPYNRVTATIADIGHADRGVILDPEVPLVPASDVVALKADVERLQEHTWEQERAAVVAWLRNDKRGMRTWAGCIERGEHWPTEGGKL
jgi:hypothetical protein